MVKQGRSKSILIVIETLGGCTLVRSKKKILMRNHRPIAYKILLLLTFATCVQSQYRDFTRIFCYVDKNTAKIGIENLNRKLGFKLKMSTGDSIFSYGYRNEYIRGYDIRFSSVSETEWVINYQTHFGFIFGKPQSYFHEVFGSFLRQEIDTGYTSQYSDRLYLPRKKEFGELVLKTLINSGYGIYYVGQNNPFVVKWDNLLGAYVLGGFDLLSTGVAISTIFSNEPRETRLNVLYVSLGCMAFWRIFTFAVQNFNDFNTYNKMVESGYLFLRK